jgi:uncharacterized protein (DUF1015 family)
MRIFPISTLTPEPQEASVIASLGSGKLNMELLESKATKNEFSYLRVVKPQFIQKHILPDTEEFYTQSKLNFDALLLNNKLIAQKNGIFYYQQIHHSGPKIGGWILGIDAEDYLDGNIKKHENTITDKENRLMRHIAALESMAEPVLLTQKLSKNLHELAGIITQKIPFVQIADEYHNLHQIWRLQDPQDIELVIKEFLNISSLYIADGHHRCAASSRYLLEKYGNRSGKGIMSLVVDEDSLLIKPFYRLIKNIDPKMFWDYLVTLNMVHEEVSLPIQYQDLNKGQFLCISTDRICKITIPDHLKGHTALHKLDVKIVESQILNPIYNVSDSATDNRLSFLRGDTSMDQVISHMKNNQIELAFLFAPNSMKEVKDVADENSIMPPKSTFVEPKIPTGLIIEDYR